MGEKDIKMATKKKAKVKTFCTCCGSRLLGDTNRKYAQEEMMLEEISDMTNSELLKVTASIKNEKAREILKQILKERLK